MVWGFWFALLAVNLAIQVVVIRQYSPGVLTLVGITLIFGIRSLCCSSAFRQSTPTEGIVVGTSSCETTTVTRQRSTPTDDGDEDEDEDEEGQAVEDSMMDCYENEFERLSGDDEQDHAPSVEAPTPRAYFLDNIKSFLTFLVVLHHSCCAFGSCGQSWPLIVGLYPNYFQDFIKGIVELNQAYFMCLFFFISAYFVPRSYESQGKEIFLLRKARRLGIPVIFITFIGFPLVMVMSLLAAGIPAASLIYIPVVAHGWFILWLIILNIVYCTIYENTTTIRKKEFPCSLERLIYGVLVCGIAMMAVVVVLSQAGGTLIGMPIGTGSLVCDLFFFGLGVIARRSGWLEGNVREKLDMPVWALRLIVVAEACGVILLSASLSQFSWDKLVGLFAVAGAFCVDMSLAVIEFFQTNLNFATPFSRFLSDAAYTVYIIHPIIVVLFTIAFIQTYQGLGYDHIAFEQNAIYSTQHLEGPGDGALALLLGWVSVQGLSQLVVWPLAWKLRQLPLLRDIL